MERFFSTLNTELLPQLPGLLSDGQLVGSPTLSLAELYQQIGLFIQDEYRRRKHPELPASPHEGWVGDGWLPRMPESLEELDGLLITVAKS